MMRCNTSQRRRIRATMDTADRSLAIPENYELATNA